MKALKLPKYDENSIMMHWSNTSCSNKKIKLPKYDENSIMMHWSNTSC